MNNKLFIGNLPYSATEEELKEAFGQAGEVQTVKIVTDRQSGRSKGFGFIEMASEEAANAAIEKLNGAEYAGRTISVGMARPAEDRPERPAREGRPPREAGGGGREGGGRDRNRGPRRDRSDGGAPRTEGSATGTITPANATAAHGAPAPATADVTSNTGESSGES